MSPGRGRQPRAGASGVVNIFSTLYNNSASTDKKAGIKELAMLKADFDFSDTSLSGEERLADFRALNLGLVLAVEHLFRRIDAYGDLLEEEVAGQPAAATYLAEVRAASAKGLTWLSTFQQSVRGALELEPLAVRLMLEACAERSRRILPTGLSLELTQPDEEIVIEGGLFQLQELFITLIQAFVEMLGSKTPGVVHASVSLLEMEERVLRLLKSPCSPGHYLAFSLSLNGAVFELEQQISFWDALMLGEGEAKDRDLVFLHVYGTVLQHGGDVVFQRLADGDGILSVLLPVKDKRKDMQAPHNIDDEAVYGTETILLVDDEDMIWDVIIDMLQELGYSVVLAGNGLEAVEIYRANAEEIDLIILDMVMPELDGHEAFFRLKEIDPGVKVLLSSGYVSEDDARDVLDAGALGFLQKPYRMIDLARIIRHTFDAKPG